MTGSRRRLKKRVCELSGMTEEEAEKKYKLSKYDYIIGSEIDFL